MSNIDSEREKARRSNGQFGHWQADDNDDVELTPPVFTTKRDVLDHDLLPALGEHAEDFDVDAIFDETYVYNADRGGFVHVGTEDEFWSVVQRCDRSSQQPANVTPDKIVDDTYSQWPPGYDYEPILNEIGDIEITAPDGARLTIGAESDEDGNIDGYTWTYYSSGEDFDGMTDGVDKPDPAYVRQAIAEFIKPA